MADPKHVEKLQESAEAWNEWRRGISADHRTFFRPELDGADLSEFDLNGADLSNARLTNANLRGVNLVNANLDSADLDCSDLQTANLSEANLFDVSFRQTSLLEVDFFGARIRYGNFQEADLTLAHFVHTSILGVDLSGAKSLEKVVHAGPCPIDIETLYRSKGKIPKTFLRGCGVPDNLIEYIPTLLQGMEPIQFHSCFISYSSKDDEFAKRLYSRMEHEHLRVWYAPDDMQGGRKMHDQIHDAIQRHDKVLLVLSECSMASEWVRTEIRRAHKREFAEKGNVLFPIRLVNMDTIRAWQCFDADTGKDLAIELREYHIPDFSGWKDHDKFEVAFARLLKDLRAEQKTKAD